MSYRRKPSKSTINEKQNTRLHSIRIYFISTWLIAHSTSHTRVLYNTASWRSGFSWTLAACVYWFRPQSGIRKTAFNRIHPSLFPPSSSTSTTPLPHNRRYWTPDFRLPLRWHEPSSRCQNGSFHTVGLYTFSVGCHISDWWHSLGQGLRFSILKIIQGKIMLNCAYLHLCRVYCWHIIISTYLVYSSKQQRYKYIVL